MQCNRLMADTFNMVDMLGLHVILQRNIILTVKEILTLGEGCNPTVRTHDIDNNRIVGIDKSCKFGNEIHNLLSVVCCDDCIMPYWFDRASDVTSVTDQSSRSTFPVGIIRSVEIISRCF